MSIPYARRIQLCRLAAISASVAAVLVSAVPASAAGTLDESQTSSSAGTACLCEPFARLAQTFTAGITGDLVQVDLLLYRAGSPGDLTVQIRATWDGVPSDTILSATTVPEASVPIGFPGWVAVPFRAPAGSIAGTRYAIVLSAPGVTSTSPLYSWDVALGNPYASGDALTSLDSGSTWIPEIGNDGTPFDRAFKTYVSDAEAQLADLETAVEGIGPGTSLTDKVADARAALASGNAGEACEILVALGHQIAALKGRSITEQQAAELLAAVARIRAVVAC